jgi:uracil-DNA glycosylase family 4
MKFEKIKEIKSVGIRKAYDLSIKGRHKGYLVNGIQTHNSGGDFRSDFCIEDAFNTFEDGIAFKKKYPRVTKIAMRLESQSRTKGQHAAAIVISKENLKDGDRCSLEYGNKKELLTNWDKYDIEHAGLMKLDVLGLKMLTILNEARKMVKKNYGADIDYYNLPLDDKKCFKEFSKGNNIGCFQVGSLGLRKFCKELGIDDFQMLVHATSLFRPGTLRSGLTMEFVKRKNGEADWESIHPIIDELTKDTYGIILYQEQVMKFMYELGGLGWRTCDTVRKVISKSQGVEQFKKFKNLFAEGCVKRKTLDKETAEELWDQLSSFGSYSFNLSHAVEYSLITYWDMWMKLNYTKEFICSSLIYEGDDDKKEEIMNEAFRFGLKVRMPKVGISLPDKWIIKDDILYCPFIEIKGIGPKTANKLKSMKKGDNKFFDDGKKIGKKFNDILDKIGAFNDCDYDDDFAESVDEYFKFSFVKNRSRKFKKIIELLSESLHIEKVKKGLKVHNKENYFFGYMTMIKFGYREKVSGLKEKKTETKGMADSLGGVYGNFKDDSDFSMMIFGSDIYKKKKDEIEHCTDKFLLAHASSHKKKQSLFCNSVWFEDEILSGNMEGLELNLAKKRRYTNDKLLDCNDCSLREECSKPVMPSRGIYNIMIIGEAPGRDEDKNGKGFVGSSGNILWSNIKRHGFKRKHFTVTNVVKCYPSKTKTPTKRHINKCSRWLDEEIENIKPFLILSFGNTGLKYFKNEESGIMAKNGTTEWSNKYGCWICWCIHPASVIYHRENEELFKIGIDNFIKKAKKIGGIE